MKLIISFFIFCLVLFLYLHIQFHLKTSNDLEIYEIEQTSKEKLEEICDLRQPVLFDYDENINKIINNCCKNYLLKNYPIFSLKIRENKKNENKGNEKNENKQNNKNENFYVYMNLNLANKLFEEDKLGQYFSENNEDFLKETGVYKAMNYNDEFLRPYLVSNYYYDIIMGSENATTPFKYEINYRNYFLVSQGNVTIKLSPPKSSKYLYVIKDYENLEFRSQIDVWNIQEKYKHDFEKVKCLEINLTPGKFLFIPAYWFYSFKLSKDSSICCFKYRTYMNNIAISPYIFLYTLQNNNIELKLSKIKENLNITNNNISRENINTETIRNENNTSDIKNIMISNMNMNMNTNI